MKAITDYTKEEYDQIYEKMSRLHEAIKGHMVSDLLSYKKTYKYAKYTFSGTYNDKLVELLGHHPDEEEIILLVDSGYSHFGASCTIDTRTKTFSGHVYID